jgi:hypothetical protein
LQLGCGINQADGLVGGSDAVQVIVDTVIAKKGTASPTLAQAEVSVTLTFRLLLPES